MVSSHLRRVLRIPIVLVLALCICSPSGASTASQLKNKLLSLSDLPDGWYVTHRSGTASKSSGCLSSLKKTPKHGTKTSVKFATGDDGIPFLGEILATGPGEESRLSAITRGLAKCSTVSFTSKSGTLHGTIQKLSFPRVASKSAAYSMTFTITGIDVSAALVLFGTGSYVGVIMYFTLGGPTIATVERYVDLAVNKVEGKGSNAANDSAASPQAAPL